MTRSLRQLYRTAVGIAYDDRTDAAPLVCVKGDATIADEIARHARRFGIPIVEREEIAELLVGVPLDESIPEDLYEAVALIFAELRSLRP